MRQGRGSGAGGGGAGGDLGRSWGLRAGFGVGELVQSGGSWGLCREGGRDNRGGCEEGGRSISFKLNRGVVGRSGWFIPDWKPASYIKSTYPMTGLDPT